MNISLSHISVYKSLTELSSDSLNWRGAVIICIVEDSIAFIKRNESMPSHKGQIAFFGGHKSEFETDPIETAKRELIEETGLDLSLFDFWGMTTPVQTLKAKWIVPVVAKYSGTKKEFLHSVKSNGEWDDLILTPIDFLIKSKNWQIANVSGSKNYQIYFSSLNQYNSASKFCDSEFNYVLWGATAKMLVYFFQIHFQGDK